MDSPSNGSLPRWFLAFFLLIIVASFAARNLPWHLDNYDQAKQAFTSHEMVQSGNWWFQHTPAGKVATKPPLAGWISTLLYHLLGRQWWEGAWRIPSFLSALLIVLILWKEGGARLNDNVGSVLAAGAFALNVFTPRLATLVRTDMLIALFIFVVGVLVLRKLRAPAPWSFAEKSFLFLALLGGVFTKGPIIYAFLLPGLVAYSLFARKWNLERRVWGGIWCWLVPLLAFGSWVGVGIMNNPQFYEEVVLKEFLGRFDVSDAPVHKHQPVYFYIGHLLLRFAPWSLLLIAFFGRREVREARRIDPQLLWLLCWSVGGLLLMSAVPSKRFDRIFPVVPPLCLLLVAAAAHLPEGRWRGHRLKTLVLASVGLAICISVGYIYYSVQRGFRDEQRRLVHFCEAVKRDIGPTGDRLAVISGDDEGMLLYLNQSRFTGIDGAAEKWRAGTIEWLVIPEPLLAKHAKRFGTFERRLIAQRAIGKNSSYVLIRRARSNEPLPR